MAKLSSAGRQVVVPIADTRLNWKPRKQSLRRSFRAAAGRSGAQRAERPKQIAFLLKRCASLRASLRQSGRDTSASRLNFSELGEERGKQLIFIKRLIAGFVPHTRAEVFEAIKGLRTSKCPFGNLPEPRKSPHALTAEVMRQCVWVKPERRCEVEFVERTKGRRLRHAEFRQLVG